MPCHPEILVVAAFAPELAGLGSGLGSIDALGEHAVRSVAVGIGLPAAAAGAAQALASALAGANGPAAVVMIGTCGAYPGSGLAVGDVVVSREVWLAEPAVVDGHAAFPEVMSVRRLADADLRAAFVAAGARSVDVATTLGVTTDDAMARRLGAHAAVEHMEAFGVATACAAASVPFCAVLGVANTVGSTGRAEWRAHHQVAGDAACAVVIRGLKTRAS